MGMLISNTPIEDYLEEYSLLVKREDLSCPPPGPPFSKTRGVYRRVESRKEKLIGVLDTFHSQAGHAVARACQILGKKCVNYYPKYKKDRGIRQPQKSSKRLGARLKPLQAGRSCILYHQAKRLTEERGGYMMPNALKLHESVTETAKEVSLDGLEDVKQVLIPASSGTIASGVVKGFLDLGWDGEFIIHLGYSRSHEQVLKYIRASSGYEVDLTIVDEGYSYKDKATPGVTPEWPCNEYYDLKAFRWWLKEFPKVPTLLWNVG